MKRGDLVRVPGEAGNLWMVVRYVPDPHDIELVGTMACFGDC